MSLDILIGRLWRNIRKRRKIQLVFLLVLMLVVSLAEVVSIGAVLPFLAVLTAPETVFSHPLAQPLIVFFQIESSKQLILPLTIGFGFSALMAGALRLLLLWASIRLSFATGADLSIQMYRATLYQPYIVHCRRNSSEVISGIADKADIVIYSVIVPLLTLVSSSFLLFMILMAMLVIDAQTAILAFFGFGAIYFLIVLVTSKQLHLDSFRIARETNNVIRSLQEGLGGIRDVIIDGTQSTYIKIFRSSDLALRRAQGNTAFISASPRSGMEALGMFLISILAFSLANRSSGIIEAIPVLGGLALGAQRALPVLQQAYAAWSSLRAGQVSLQDALELLEQQYPDELDKQSQKPSEFKENIRLTDVSFAYGDEAVNVLNNVSFQIPKGGRVGLVGKTGSGKSTLIDILMGLLEPKSGKIEIDGFEVTKSNRRNWQLNISHVPPNYIPD
jgi:ATP-binding cassette subfamily B protein